MATDGFRRLQVSSAPPRKINVQKFAESRAPELETLHTIVSNRVNNDFRSRRSKRRRTTAYDNQAAKKRCRKKRKLGLVDQSSNALPPEKDEKNVPRRIRRRTELKMNLENGFCTSGDGTKRLRTHIWHAKRFTMTKLWGYYLPLGLQGRGRGSKAVLKWFKDGMLVHDASYHVAIQLEGPEDSLLSVLEMVMVPSSSSAPSVISGIIYDSAMLHHLGAPFSTPIAPVTYMWRPSGQPSDGCNGLEGTENSSTFRQLWVWIHASVLTEAYHTLKLACQKEMDNRGILINCISLEGQLAKLEVVGLKAFQLLQRTLYPTTRTRDDSWNLMKHSVSEAKDDSQSKIILEKEDSIPSHAILSLNVKDPRTLTEKEKIAYAPESGSSSILGDVLGTERKEHVVFGRFSDEPEGSGMLAEKSLWDVSSGVSPPVEEEVICKEKHDQHKNFLCLDDSSSGALNTSTKSPCSRSCPIMLLKNNNGRGLNIGMRQSMLLFQSCGDIVKEDLMKVMVDFFNCGIINAITNETFICLIPKKKESIKVSDFRPISLVTSLYKMVSKVLASRLREVLGSTISSYQSAFVQGRQILDAALIANEVVEESRRLNKSGMVFKIDLEKAYDHVEWRFVDEVLIRKGFGDRWRSWIRGCLETANFSVMINGRPRGKFRASRGLRQGDPLSPFLFTLVMDVLSRIMEKAQDADKFHGLSPGLGMVEVSHLQFADDTIFFIEDKDEYWNNLLQILELFCFVSGMKMNKSKCSLVGINLDDGLLNELAGAWGCEVGAWPMSYLGLPLGGNPRALKFWDPVVEKVENRLQKWKRACLSKGGRLTMIQAVLCSIPIYYMSLFRIPIGVANRIEKLMRDFLWEGLDGKRNHAVSWEVVGKAKFCGGLGVGSLRARSAALRAKWLWRFPNEPHALWHKVIKSIYGMDTNGWDAKPATRGSCRSPWRDISSGYNLFLQGCVFEVGCGARVRFWEDDWSRGGVLKEVFPRLFNLSRKQNHNISSFTGSDGFALSWDFGFRRNLNELDITEAARLLDLLEGVRVFTSRLDKRRWKLDPSGLFTCHSFCSHIQNRDEGEIFSPYTQIWKAKTPPKVKIFVWQAVLGKLNTGDTLQRRCPYLCISPHWCALCNKAGESVDHLLIHCPFSLKLWETLLKEVNTVWVIPEGCFELFSIRFDALGRGKKAKILWGSLMQAVVWNLWMERNRRIFEDYKGVGVAELWDRVKFWAALWASTSPAFKDVPYPIIMRNLLAVVS